MRGMDKLLRDDGYVTASEVAKATGWAISTVHRKIIDGSIPGERISTGWYVDIHATVKLFPEGTSVHTALVKLTKLVARAARPRLSPKRSGVIAAVRPNTKKTGST